MPKSNPYKRTLAGLLLGFSYPDDGRQYFEAGTIPIPAFVPETLAAYPAKEELQSAVAEILRANVRQNLPSKTSVEIIEHAYNEHVKVTLQVRGRGWGRELRDVKYSLERIRGLGRIVTEALFNYLEQDGPEYCSICEVCEKVFLPAKSKQRFCSDQCRWDYWNTKKMEGYYAAAKKRSRAHKKRIQKLKGGKRK